MEAGFHWNNERKQDSPEQRIELNKKQISKQQHPYHHYHNNKIIKTWRIKK